MTPRNRARPFGVAMPWLARAASLAAWTAIAGCYLSSPARGAEDDEPERLDVPELPAGGPVVPHEVVEVPSSGEEPPGGGGPDGPPFGWTVTFGSWGADQVNGVAVAPEGTILVAGTFTAETIDLDPGQGEDLRTSTAATAMFLVGLDQRGGYLWGMTSSGPGSMVPAEVTATRSGTFLVVGNLVGTQALSLIHI